MSDVDQLQRESHCYPNFLWSSLLFSQIASRIHTKWVTCGGFSSDSKVSVTNSKPRTFLASIRQQWFSISQVCQNFDRIVLPDLRELPFLDVPEGHVPPELVRVNTTQVVDASHALAGRVSSVAAQ